MLIGSKNNLLYLRLALLIHILGFKDVFSFRIMFLLYNRMCRIYLAELKILPVEYRVRLTLSPLS